MSKDIGEQNDVASAQAEKVKALSAKLDTWIAETGAKIPQPDDRFDAAKKEQQLKQAITKSMEKLEKQHLNFLDPNFKPNADWWGSKVTKD